jgi:hypothetical protein
MGRLLAAVALAALAGCGGSDAAAPQAQAQEALDAGATADAGVVSCPLQRETRRSTENDATIVYYYQRGKIVGACTWFDAGPRSCYRVPIIGSEPDVVPDATFDVCEMPDV